MRRRPALLLALVLARPAVAGEAEDALTAKVTAMARVGRSFAPSFSPDGSELVLISDLSGVPQAWIVPSAGGWPRMLTNGADPVNAVSWSPDGKWIAYVVAPGGGLNTQIHVVRPDGTGGRRLTDGGKDNNWLGPWSLDGSSLAFSSNRGSPDMDSYVVAPEGGEPRLVARNPGTGEIAGISRDNRVALVERLRSRGDNDLFLVDLSTGKETLLTRHTPPAQFSGALAPDGRTVYLATNAERDLSAFGRIRIAADGTAGPIEILAERSDAELDAVILDPRGTIAALAWNAGGRTELGFYDVRAGKVSRGPALPAEIASGFEFSKDATSLAFNALGPRSPLDVHVLDRRSGRIRKVTSSPHVGVDLAALVRPELVRYRAHDGLELSGWLYRPPGASGPGPVVLSFHGGPEGQERPSFRADYQALVSQGLSVFAPNVRGSSGFGKRFVNLDNGALRVDGVRDIRSTVDHLVSAGIADPKRVGITGGSYGGYMTMAGLTEFPDLFAAGANLFGIFNFQTFFEHTEPWMAAISTVEYGDPRTQADLLRSLSPIHKVDRIAAPLMVLHGANDTNVPVVEAEQVVETLKKRGVTVEYVLFPDEGHGWRKVPNRIRSTLEITRFFAKHLGGRPVAAR